MIRFGEPVVDAVLASQHPQALLTMLLDAVVVAPQRKTCLIVPPIHLQDKNAPSNVRIEKLAQVKG
jgi:hypothetical protein